MTIDNSDLLASILSSISRIDYIKPEEIPDIELYMDQVTTFMESHLKSSKRYPEDKILTKTMINNYAKNDLLPPPVKKKYSREHLLMLTFIYYFKNILSINDIQRLLEPLARDYFHTEEAFDLTALYNEIVHLELDQIVPLEKDITRKYHMAQESFPEVPEDEKEFMHTFAFICMLSFDVYLKKQLIEKLVDQLPEKPDSKKKKK
ncbi:MAG: DUF1836 domain-containing protein [Lachnospiraceae bacterium]